MEEKVFFEGEFGKVCGVLHTVDETSEIAIIIHGFSSYKGTGAVDISKKLNSIGINALRIDLDNQGESDLDFQTGVSIPNYIKQVEAAMKYCKSLGYEEMSLVGTSYGGTVAFAVGLFHPEIKRMVLRAPVVDYKEHAELEFGKEGVQKIIDQGYWNYTKRNGNKYKVSSKFITEAYPYSMYERAQEVQIPTLIIHGDTDDDVDFKTSLRAIEYFPNGKIHIIKGADHSLGIEGDFSEGLQALADFFKP